MFTIYIDTFMRVSVCKCVFLFPIGKVVNIVPLSPKDYGNSIRQKM